MLCIFIHYFCIFMQNDIVDAFALRCRCLPFVCKIYKDYC